MLLQEYISSIKLDLGSVPESWSEQELTRALYRACADINRFYPCEKYYEYLVSSTVTNEDFTTASAHGTPASLVYHPIKVDSVVVKNTAGTVTYTVNTDYVVDYVNGKITTLSTGTMVVSTQYHVSYIKSNVAIGLNSITSGLIRVTGCEYPAGQVPQKLVSFSVYGDVIYIGSQGEKQSQGQINDSSRIIVYYESEHTLPTELVASSLPLFLDQVICSGASAYALIQKSLYYRLQAAVSLAAVSTLMGSISTTDIGTALTMVDTLKTAFDSALAEITTQAGYAKTYADNTATAVNVSTITDWLNSASAPSLSKYLSDGDDFINKSNDGQSVAENYSKFAEVCSEAAKELIDKANTLAQVAYGYSNVVGAIGKKVDAIANMAANYVQVASQRVQVNQVILSEADKYTAIAERYYTLADTILKEGQDRRSEFWTVLKDKAEYRRRGASSSLKQMQ